MKIDELTHEQGDCHGGVCFIGIYWDFTILDREIKNG